MLFIFERPIICYVTPLTDISKKISVHDDKAVGHQALLHFVYGKKVAVRPDTSPHIHYISFPMNSGSPKVKIWHERTKNLGRRRSSAEWDSVGNVCSSRRTVLAFTTVAASLG